MVPITYRAKNHISPGEPYFAIFYHNNFQRVEVNFSHFFYLLGKTNLDFIGIKDIIMFLRKMQKLKEIKISGEIWSPGEIWFFALHILIDVI